MINYFALIALLFFYTTPARSSWIELVGRKQAPDTTEFHLLATDQYPSLHRHRSNKVTNSGKNPKVHLHSNPAKWHENDDAFLSLEEDELPCRSEESAKIVLVFDGKYPFYLTPHDPKYDWSDSKFCKELAQTGELTSLIERMFTLFSFSSIGVTSYSDWKTTSDDNLYCYNLRDPKLRPDSSFYPSIYPKNAFPQNGTLGWDSVLNAILYTVMEGNIDWKSPKKVIIFISNNNWKWEGDSNNKKGPEYQLPSITMDMMGDKRDTFCGYRPVSKKLFFDLTENYKIIGLLTPNGSNVANNFFNDPPKNEENYKMLRISKTDAEAARSIPSILFPALRPYLCTCKVVYEYALVVDTTMTFVDTFRSPSLPNYVNGSYLTRLLRVVEPVVRKLSRENQNSKFHLTIFGDYPTEQNGNLSDTFCYKYVMTTSHVNVFLNAIKSIDSTYGGRDKDESSLTAILYTAKEPKIKWTMESTPHTNKVVRIIAVATDAYFKLPDEIPPLYAGPEYSFPVPEGYADCNYGPPKLSTIIKLMEVDEFYLTPMIYGYSPQNNWDRAFIQMWTRWYWFGDMYDDA